MTAAYSRALLEAAAAASELTLTAVWRLLSIQDRQQALTIALSTGSPGWARRYLAEELTGRLSGFRLSTILSWDDAKLAAAAVKQRLDRPALVHAAIIALHLTERRSLQAAFFDALGLQHQDGYLTAELEEPAADQASLDMAAKALLERYPNDAALYYLVALTVIAPKAWPGLTDWLRLFAEQHGVGRDEQLALETLEATATAASTAPPAERRHSVPDRHTAQRKPSIGARAANAESASLSVLDHQLTLAIVDGTSGITGALSMAEIDAMLDEVVRLNGRRHQTFYHVGFRDVMFARPVAEDLPAENPVRWMWYFAGYIVGLARQKRSEKIVELFDEHSAVRELGGTGRGPSAIAAEHVFGSLCRADRHAEAARFVSDEAAFHCAPLVHAVIEEATTLLRQERPSLAEPMFDTLWRALARRKAELLEVDDDIWNDVRRRRAHCLRLRDSAEAARPLLEEVFEDSDLNGRAAILADLGLLDAGYRRLFELAYPANKADVPDVVLALSKGTPRFIEAIDLGVPASAHAQYICGFVALLDGRFKEAVELLDHALAAFEARPEVYSGGNLLVRARLHLGVAVCHMASDVVRLPRAGTWVADAIRQGETLPAYLIEDVLDALALVDSRLATDAAEQILKAAGVAVLDLLVSSAAAQRSRVIVDGLVARARSGTKGVTHTVQDWTTALPLLLAQERYDEAAEALDALEYHARQGVGAEAFTALVRDPTRFSPAWEVDDARWAAISCLEATANYQEAVSLLTHEGHRLLASDGPSRFTEVEAILDHVAGYGHEWASACDGLRSRLEALKAQEHTTQPEAPADVARSVRVLVVGGNEVQARYDRDLAEECRAARPGLEVEFLHTGWNSNWNGHLDDIERRLPKIDAVVMMRLMRTELGRQVRARLGATPWRGCTGRGKAAIRASILEAAKAACSPSTRPPNDAGPRP